MQTIQVDYDHNCETWWDAARAEIAAGNPPSACIGLVESFGCDSLECGDEDAAEFLEWAEKLPGWDELPFAIAVSDHPDGCSCGSPDCPKWQAAQERA